MKILWDCSSKDKHFVVRFENFTAVTMKNERDVSGRHVVTSKKPAQLLHVFAYLQWSRNFSRETIS
jgi:hypothetical protein